MDWVAVAKVSQHADYFSARVTRTRRFYHVDWKKRLKKSPGLCLVAGGSEWCAPDFVVDRADFPYVAFELVARGKGTLELAGKSHRLAAGHVYFFDARHPHVIRSDPRDPMLKYFFNFAGAVIGRLMDRLGLRTGTVLRVSALSRIASLLEEAIDHALKGTRLGYTAASVAVEHALVLCAESRITSQERWQAGHSTYLKCRDFLVQHYPELNSVNDAARRCGLTAAYLTRLFQKYGDETPHECLLRLKLAHAEQSLRQRDATVKGVAAELGFRSAAHFSRVFKRLSGAPPAHFRARGRNG
jgi:AraC-like DNA-binding protein